MTIDEFTEFFKKNLIFKFSSNNDELIYMYHTDSPFKPITVYVNKSTLTFKLKATVHDGTKYVHGPFKIDKTPEFRLNEILDTFYVFIKEKYFKMTLDGFTEYLKKNSYFESDNDNDRLTYMYRDDSPFKPVIVYINKDTLTFKLESVIHDGIICSQGLFRIEDMGESKLINLFQDFSEFINYNIEQYGLSDGYKKWMVK